MKAVRIHAHGPVDVLRVDKIERPKPGPKEVLIQMKTMALNHLDLWVRKGIPGVPLPIIMGSDGAGVVADTGEEVGDYSVGDEVVIQPLTYCGQCDDCRSGRENYCDQWGILGENQNGVMAQYVAVPARNVLPKPARLSWEEAAAFALVGQTAYQMLIRRAGLQSGEMVLIWGATSGVGSMAIQIAKARGAFVIAVAGGETKVSLAAGLGADAVIDYTATSVSDRVREITEGKGCQVIFDHVGTATWKTSLRSLRKGGRLVTCGATTGSQVDLDLRHLFYKQQTIMGSTMGDRTSMEAVWNLVDTGRVKPVVDRVFSLDEIQSAHAYLEGNHQAGKVLIHA